MQPIVMLSELWRYRRLVVLSWLIAVAISVLMAYKVSPPLKLEPRGYTVGIASTTALLDTPSSQVVDLGGRDDVAAARAGSLPGRAALLANVLTISPLKDQIAKAAGVDSRALIAGTPKPGSGLPLPSVGSVSPKSRDASFLTVTTYEGLPILGIDVTAPDARTAQKLSSGAITVLLSHLDSLAKADSVPASRRLVVKQMGEPRVATVRHGPSRKLAAVVVVLIFGLHCAAILSLSWLRAPKEEAEAWDPMPPVDWDSIGPEVYERDAPAATPHADDEERVPSWPRHARR